MRYNKPTPSLERDMIAHQLNRNVDAARNLRPGSSVRRRYIAKALRAMRALDRHDRKTEEKKCHGQNE